MVIPIALLSVWSALSSVQEADVFTFRRTSASYVVERVAGTPRSGLVPSSVSLKVDEAQNSVRLEGPKADIEHVKRYFTMFDVAPLRVEMELVGELPMVGYSFSNPVVVANNSKWRLSEPQVGLDLAVLARINDDGYVTIFLEMRSSGTERKFNVRIKPGEAISVDQRGVAWKPGNEPIGEPDQGPPFQLKLTLKGIVLPKP